MKVIGINAIADFLKVINPSILMDWRIGYDLPVEKSAGVWIASKSALKKWRKANPEVKEEIRIVREQPKIITKRAPRWGL